MLDKMKDAIFGVEEYDEFDTPEQTDRSNKKKKLPVSDNVSLFLAEPRSVTESEPIAQQLKNKKTVVVNLHRVTPEQAQRIIDFLSGTVFAIDGEIKKVDDNIFLCAPNNVNIEEDENNNAE